MSTVNSTEVSSQSSKGSTIRLLKAVSLMLLHSSRRHFSWSSSHGHNRYIVKQVYLRIASISFEEGEFQGIDKVHGRVVDYRSPHDDPHNNDHIDVLSSHNAVENRDDNSEKSW